MVISRTSPEWNELEFGVICDVQNGYAFKSENFISHGIPIIKIANIQDGKVVIDEASSYPEISISDNFFVNTGDILLAMSGATTGKVGVYTGKRRLYLNQRVCKMVCKDSSKTYYPYVKYLLSSNLFVKQLESSLTAGAQPNLSPKQVSKMIFKIPSYDEQKAIASALSDVDELIENLEKLIRKKRDIRSGLVHDIFFEQISNNGHKSEWIKMKFSDMFDALKGRGLSKEKLSDNGLFECVLYGELFTKYGEIIDHVISRTNAKEGLLSVSGDVLMPGSTTTEGKDLAIASAITKSGILLGGDIVVWRPKVDFDSRIIGILMPVYVNDILPATQGITIVHLKIDTMKDLEITIPKEKQEQTDIVNMFVELDREIDGIKKKLAKYRRIKQGMMQKLLTGEIRLV